MADATGAGSGGRQTSLDIVRGLAALEVAAGHLRNFMFVGADATSSVPWKAFVVLTGQAHGAVVVFFVLSGYLIGKTVVERFERERWSWGDYAINRLSRLWIVVIPALLLTALLDAIGRHGLDGSLYLGRLDPNAYGASIPTANDLIPNHSFATFIGNVFFLQYGILVPPYGINGPLWSLANEFWYYVMFPLGVCALGARRGTASRLVCGSLFAVIAFTLPMHVLVYGAIWLMGAAVACLARYQDRLSLRRVRRPAAIGTTMAFVLGLYVIPRYTTLGPLASDFVVASLFAVLLGLIAHLDMADRGITRTLTRLSDISFTLYLTHFPFFALALCAIDDNRKIPPSFGALLLYAGLLVAALTYAFAVFWVSERHTRRLQRRLLVFFSLRSP